MEKLQNSTQCKIFVYFRFVPKNFNAVITLKFDGKVCLELYSNIRNLGRVTLRSMGETIGAGIITEFIN